MGKIDPKTINLIVAWSDEGESFLEHLTTWIGDPVLVLIKIEGPMSIDPNVLEAYRIGHEIKKPGYRNALAFLSDKKTEEQ